MSRFHSLRRGALVILVALAATAALPAAEARADYTAIVVDANNGNVLHERNADKRMYPASLTKMMTLYMMFEAVEQGRFTMKSRLGVSTLAASREPAKLGLRSGSSITVEHAILALVTKSANDVATVVAEAIGGTEWEFARMMTARAKALGMNSTVFRNASGLPDSEMISTARDMARLSVAMMRDFPQYYHYFSTNRFTYNGVTYGNHNKLLGRFDGVDGLKTGYTRAAGWNLAASAVRNGRRVVAVVMGAPSSNVRNAKVAAYLTDGFVRSAYLDGSVPVPSVGPGEGQPTMVASSTSQGSSKIVESVPVPAASPQNDNGQATSIDDLVDQLAGNQQAMVMGQGDGEELRWALQVGAFSHPGNADAAIGQANSHLSPLLGNPDSVVTSVDLDGVALYRARIVGLTEDQARQGCVLLQRQGLPCAVVRFSTRQVASDAG